MEKVYNGAVLALPEREEELFARINERTAARREQRAQAEAEAREMALYADALPERELPRVDIRKALPWVAAVAMSVLALMLGRLM